MMKNVDKTELKANAKELLFLAEAFRDEDACIYFNSEIEIRLSNEEAKAIRNGFMKMLKEKRQFFLTTLHEYQEGMYIGRI